MRRCKINIPNRCYHLISRVAHRVLEWGKRRIERVAPLYFFLGFAMNLDFRQSSERKAPRHE